MNTKTICILFICCAFFVSPTRSHAGDVIVIGGDHNPPFRVIEGETYSGIYGEMIHEIVKGMDLEVEFRECPFVRCVAEMKSGKIDVFLALIKTPEREEYLYYAHPCIKDRTDRGFYLRKGEGSRIQKYEDLYGLRIGALRGIRFNETFDHDKKLMVEGVPSHEQNLKKLVKGRIDVIIHTEIALDYQIKRLGYGDRVEKAPFKFTALQPTYFVISKKSKFMDRAREFEANLKRISDEGLFWKLVEEWTSQNDGLKPNP